MVRAAAALLLLAAGAAAPVAAYLPWFDNLLGPSFGDFALAEIAGARAGLLVVAGVVAVLTALAALARRAGLAVLAIAAALLAGTAGVAAADVGPWVEAGPGRSVAIAVAVAALLSALAAALTLARRMIVLATVGATLLLAGLLTTAASDHPEIQVIR